MLVTLDVCGKSRVVVAFALVSILNEVTEIAVLKTDLSVLWKFENVMSFCL